MLCLRELLQSLDVGITHLLVEPGPTLASSFLGDAVADRVWVIRSPCRIDDEAAPMAAPVPPDYVASGEIDLAGDQLAEYLNPHSNVYFGPHPSADFMLIQ
jgi:riboflavin biosynthesis pyrimidine reductase